MSNEIWKRVRVDGSFLPYLVSDCGQIRKIENGLLLKCSQTKHNRGYVRAYLCGRKIRVHRIVAESFHGPAPFDDAVVMHLNHERNDNRAINLKWGTVAENSWSKKPKLGLLLPDMF